MTTEAVAAVAQESRPSAPQTPSWEPPTHALTQWLALMRAIRVFELDQRLVPCTAEPGLWWSSPTAPETARAVELCGGCPVLQLCRAYAVVAGEKDGVWGGTTPADRGWGRGVGS